MQPTGAPSALQTDPLPPAKWGRTGRPDRFKSPRRAAALPYPKLPDSKQVALAIFWRAAWLRDLAEHQALEQFVDAGEFEFTSKPKVLRHALYAAVQRAWDEAQKSLKHLLFEPGGLLYAWVPEGDAKGGAA